MKYRYKTKRIFKIETEVLEKRINLYLSKNGYRITERGPGYIIFDEDDFSNRIGLRSDFYTRIGKGKFIFGEKTIDGTYLELIYFTSLSEYMVVVMLFSAFGIYTKNIIMPIVISVLLVLPYLFRIGYLNMNVFEEILECPD